MNSVQRDLIFDLGLHRGEDTEFYLAKGFRVVAVDANSDLCDEVSKRLARYVDSGTLVVVNRAVAEEPGPITFYEDTFSAWGTVDGDWAARNRRGRGTTQRERTVLATTTAELVADYGVPYYLKIDIEGMDMVALRNLATSPDRPHYVSIESDKVSFRALRHEFETLTDLGYDAFKLVSQRDVPRQRLPRPAREGQYVDHRFQSGSSGAFGEETPGTWITAEEAIERYRRVFLQYALTGDDPYVRSKWSRLALKAVGFRENWFDTHARLAGP